jgi:hypothetical protein
MHGMHAGLPRLKSRTVKAPPAGPNAAAATCVRTRRIAIKKVGMAASQQYSNYNALIPAPPISLM